MHRSIGLIVFLIVTGCDRVPMQNSAPEFPFEHAASEKVRRIFLRIEVYSEEDYRQLARRDRYVYDIRWLETEVMNGGIDQYFYNSAGDHAVGCLEALNAIGAKGSYSLLKNACDLFPDGQPSADRAVRQQQLREITGEDRDIDDLIKDGEIEVELYQLLLDNWNNSDPDEM